MIMKDFKRLKKKIKRALATAFIVLSGICCYIGVQSVIWYPSQEITVTGNQIAKRCTPHLYSPRKSTRVYSKDRFYVLLESQYGAMEIPVTYNTYLHSSNDEVHSFRIDLQEAMSYLDNPQALLKSYPGLRYSNIGVIPLIFGIIFGVVSLAVVITNVSIWIFDQEPVPGAVWVFSIIWFLVNLIGLLGGLL